MPKLITMRESLAESTWSPYDQPGRSDRLWHHKAVGDIAPSSSGSPGAPMPPPVINMPIDVPAIAQSMCAAAGKAWDDVTKQCLDQPAPKPKTPFWTPMTTALVALGIVGVGAVWAFGGGKTKRARSNRRRR